jgi:hypothetical protein
MKYILLDDKNDYTRSRVFVPLDNIASVVENRKTNTSTIYFKHGYTPHKDFDISFSNLMNDHVIKKAKEQ